MKIGAHLRRPLAYGIADQAVSSATNFGLAILVARAVDSSAFGAFSLAFGTYILSLIASRALTSEPFVARYSAAPASLSRKKATEAAGMALALGAVIGAGCVAVGLVQQSYGSGVLGSVLVVLGLTLPGLLLQDVWRWIFFAKRTGSSAVANDLVWAICLFAAIGALTVLRIDSIELFVLAWGGSAGIAALFGVWQARIVPRPAACAAWLREERQIAGRYLAELGTASGAAQLALFAVGACAGLAAVGSLRLALLLLGPLNVLVMGIGLVAVPEGTRALARSTGRLLRLSRLVAIGLSTAALVWGSIIFFTPAAIGTRVLHDAWAPAHDVVLPVALGVAATGIAAGALVGLRSLVAADLSLQASLAIAPMIVVGAALGAAIGDAVGAGFGLAAALWCGAAVYWVQLARALRRRRPARSWQPLAVRSAG